MKRLSFVLLALTGSMVAAGCVHRIPEANPEDIPRLEQALASNPGNPEILTQLGMARFKARSYAEAENALTQAVETGEAPGAAYLYLGLTREEMEKWGGAREAYSSYVERGRYGPLKEEIQRRLALIARQELRAQAREALAMEDQLSTADPRSGTVAVFPFQVVTENEDLLPLQVALADMMTTDLALSGGVTVLERTRIQSLLNEMAMSEAGLTEAETGARAGRLLRAEHVIQGALSTLPEQNLRFDTDVLNTVRRESTGEATAQSPLEQLFDMEKETVFQLLDILGVEITPAEREAINDNRAANLLAFLAYGRGLMAMDRGDYNEAQGFFNQAVQFDPSFDPALEGQAEAGAMEEAAGTDTDEVAGRAEGELTGQAVGTTDPGVTGTGTSSMLGSTINEVAPTPTTGIVGTGTMSSGTTDQGQNRDPTQESKGQEGVTTPTTASIQITIRRPGGGD